jgi:hypothetical protein
METVASILNHYGSDTIWDHYNGAVARIILAENYQHTFSIEYTNVDKLPQFLVDAATEVSSVDSDSFKECKKYKNGHLLIHRGNLSDRAYEIYGYYHLASEMQAVYDELKTHKPKVTEKEHQTPIHFWHLEKTAKRTIKTIQTPSWSDIASNYPVKVRDDLKSLIDLNPENLTGGKIILWRGLPGTGKTWCIRALTESWKSWCTSHYIIDLDNFLGDSVNYMLGLIAKLHALDEDDGDDDDMAVLESRKKKWNLLILEDAGEFVSYEAKAKGSALTKLLNIGDGMLGQGMNLLILITTNQELEDIHEAVSRQGRCLSNLEFPKFDSKEARDWLKSHNFEGDVPPSLTLSDLYSVLPNAKRTVLNKTRQRKKMGFV